MNVSEIVLASGPRDVLAPVVGAILGAFFLGLTLSPKIFNWVMKDSQDVDERLRRRGLIRHSPKSAVQIGLWGFRLFGALMLALAFYGFAKLIWG
jgi:hypothetical protein